jgi:hypothetical protein
MIYIILFGPSRQPLKTTQPKPSEPAVPKPSSSKPSAKEAPPPTTKSKPVKEGIMDVNVLIAIDILIY